ncbi:MAG: repeat protein, partial [Planctomycetaceae bacterium]|nr:repeat protein [Planctomycetaceae bacterium]
MLAISLASCRPAPAIVEPAPSSPAVVKLAFATPAVPQPVSAPTVPRAARSDDWFEDVTPTTGVNFTYRTGRETLTYSMVESFGGGVALFDFDNDGDTDVLVTGGGQISQAFEIRGRAPGLFRNDGNWNFVDVTAEAGLSQANDYSHGITVGDFNADGFSDLYFTCYGHSHLYQNDGAGWFHEVTVEAKLELDGWRTAATWADVDRDGWPDLYVCGYVEWQPDPKRFCGDAKQQIRDVCMPRDLPATSDRLFRNRGDGTFQDISATAGLRSGGKGLGVVAADIDRNGWIDFYVANDVEDNFLYLGGPGGKLEEVGAHRGVSGNEYGIPEGSMGVDFADVNGDGFGDLFVTNYEQEDNSLYRNDGTGNFNHATVAMGLGGSNRPWVGFGTGFVDFDSDGWLDLFVMNGHVTYHVRTSAFEQPALLYRNLSGQRLQDISERGGPWFSVPHVARGAATGDLDHDGAPDLVVVQQDAPIAILRNRNPAPH